jgi:hypothetical protein
MTRVRQLPRMRAEVCGGRDPLLHATYLQVPGRFRVARKLRGSETASTKKVLFRIQYLTCGKLRVQFDARFTAYPAAWNPFGPRQEGSMKQSEKRANVRCLLQIPVRFRCFEIACANLEIPGQTINISRSGLFLISAQRLKVGSSLSLTLRVPTEISGSALTNCDARGVLCTSKS